jgi:cell division protein FtsN
MPKDYAKFVPPKSRLNLPHRWPVKLAIAVSVVVVLAGLGGYYYIASSEPAQADFMTKLNALIHHKKIIGKEPAKLASVAPAPPRTVRFDFYEQLPNMQMPGDPPLVSSAPVPIVEPALTPAPKMATAAAMPVAMPTPVALPSPVKGPEAFNPDELTHLLEAEHPKPVPAMKVTPAPPALAANHFSLQMGDFDTDSGAKGLVSAIKSVGFDARVVKISRSGRTIYQVQQGPFESMAQASQAQLRMQKRGLISSIIKSI